MSGEKNFAVWVKALGKPAFQVPFYGVFDNALAFTENLAENIRCMFGEDVVVVLRETDEPQPKRSPRVYVVTIPAEDAEGNVVGDTIDSVWGDESKARARAKELMASIVTEMEVKL